MPENLYLKIREERIKQGLSQKELGEMVGLPQQAINRIEQGQRKLDVELFEKLCKALKIRKIGSFNVNIISSYYKTDTDNIEPCDTDESHVNLLIHDLMSQLKESENLSRQTMDDLTNVLITSKDKLFNNTNSAITQLTEALSSCYRGNDLLNNYQKLNAKGQDKAVEQVEMLTKIPEYRQSDTTTQALNAAHERTDVEVAEEMRKHDDDMMMDDSEWE